MLGGIDNLIEITLGLKKLKPNFQTLPEIPVLIEDQDRGAKDNHESDHSAT